MTEISKVKTVVLCLCFVLMAHSWSSAEAPYLEHYTKEDGLGASRVDWVEIGSDGTKWFGLSYPEEGVTRFDELNWDTFLLGPGGNDIVDMTLDRYGRVWLALIHMPAYAYLEDGEFHEIPVNFPTITVGTAIMFDPQGNLWGGGWGSGDIPYVGRSGDDGMTWTFWETDTFPLDFDVDLQGRVWFAGYHGLYRQTLNGENWERIDDDVRLPSGDYVRVSISETGRIWVQQFGSGTIFYSDDDPEYANWTQLEFPATFESGGSILNSVAISDGIWFSYQDGAMWFHDEDWRLFPFQCPVFCASLDDNTGDVWFGTLDGVYVMRGGPDAWPPVWIELEAGGGETRGSEAFSLMASAKFQMNLQLDLYVAVQFPDDSLFFAPDWSPAMAPYVSNLSVPIGLNVEQFPLIDFDMMGLPEGTYRWFAACTHAGTMEYASNIASCEFIK